MTNTEVLKEYFIWEEKNSIEHQKNYENKNVSEINDTITNTKINSMQTDWTNITDPKLRKKMRKKAWRDVNRDKIKIKNKTYRDANRDQIKEYKKVYREINSEKVKLQQKTKYVRYKDKIKVQRKIWNEVNKDKIKLQKKNYRNLNKAKLNDYMKNRRKTNIQFKLGCNLRNRLRIAINNNQKAGSAVKDLGCTVDELKIYLESKFQPDMNWDNWSLYGWHIDHIKPLTSFDLSDRKQMLEACHYTNLQPLWAKDNLAKNDKII